MSDNRKVINRYMKSILIFGLGSLQKSLIKQCKTLGIRTIGLDPTPNPICKNDVDVFRVVPGDDFDMTIAVAKDFNVDGLTCAATDKPLVMMARIAELLSLPFYSVETAEWSTDKFLMKQRFNDGGVPCAKGRLVNSFGEFESEHWEYPVIVKPRDNSGSRGVIYCKDASAVREAMTEAFQFTKKTDVLIEEYIDGQEYSIEGIHYKGKSYVIQYTQKRVTSFPYNVELGHIQPADLTEEQKQQINEVIGKIAKALHFDNCGSHTELKIGRRGVVVIETSPRLGGGMITSHLVPLSTGINMEQLTIKMAINESLDENDFIPTRHQFSTVQFFNLPQGVISRIKGLDILKEIDGVLDYEFELKEGDEVPLLTNGLKRYGQVLLQAPNRKELLKRIELINDIIKEAIKIS